MEISLCPFEHSKTLTVIFPLRKLARGLVAETNDLRDQASEEDEGYEG